MMRLLGAGALLFVTFPLASAAAQHGSHDHGAMTQDHGAAMSSALPSEAGQDAFAAIAEIVARLDADPATDWDKVDISALRDHLVDMDNVLTRTRVDTENVEGGAAFDVYGADAAATASVGRMLAGHSAMLDSEIGFSATVMPIDGGTRMTVTSPDPARIARLRALGFYGLLTEGMHHQRHHFAMARGSMMH